MFNIKNYFMDLEPEIKEYFKLLHHEFPEFLIPYIGTETLRRLKGVGFFCGMDYASEDIYDFKYYFSRLEHSVATALMVWDFTNDKTQTLAALFHDAGTPACSHAVDYAFDDAEQQECSEICLVEYLAKDEKLLQFLEKDGITLEEVANYKNYPLVDVERPKLCADRIEGIFSSSLVWTQSVSLLEIKNIYEAMVLKENEDEELEFCFFEKVQLDRFIEQNDIINQACHADEDYYFMVLLGRMIRYIVDIGAVTKEDLHDMIDAEVFEVIEEICIYDDELAPLYYEFKSLKQVEPQLNKIPIKERNIEPMIIYRRNSRK